MSIFALTNEIIFPPVELSDENGILAIGGDLSPERLIDAYSSGISPGIQMRIQLSGGHPTQGSLLNPEKFRYQKV